MNNQWGQEIGPGAVVGYVNKTGSYSERKLGVVLDLGTRKRDFGSNPENTAHVLWVLDGSYGAAETHLHRGTVGLKRLFKLDPESLDPDIKNTLQAAYEGAK